jgi:hypothetical protein
VHPVLHAFLDAAAGRFPAVDGTVEYVTPLDRGLEAVIAFTGHALMATRLGPADFDGFHPDGFGGALHPAVLLQMAGRAGWVGSVDVTMVAMGTGGGHLARRTDLDDHPRVRHALSLRAGVRVFGDDRGFVTLAHGLAGRPEMSVEVAAGLQGGRLGPGLIDDALGLVSAGEPVFAAVAPGNARSLRAFLACGFTPIASEVIVRAAAP